MSDLPGGPRAAVAADDGLVLVYTLTRDQPPRVERLRPARRPGDARGGLRSPLGRATAFVCGPTGFVESVADSLVELGYEPGRIRTERFGPTGG